MRTTWERARVAAAAARHPAAPGNLLARLAGTGPGSVRLAARTLTIANQLGIPVVLTNAVRYADANQRLLADILDAARLLRPIDRRHLDSGASAEGPGRHRRDRPPDRHFALLQVRPSGKEQAGGRSRWNGVLSLRTLLVEQPVEADEPTRYWMTNLPHTIPVADLVRWAKMRRRMEHGYCEFTHGPRLDCQLSRAVLVATSSPPTKPSTRAE